MSSLKRWSVMMAWISLGVSACQGPQDLCPPGQSPATMPASGPAVTVTLAQPRVLVEKAKRRLTLYDGGHVVKVYRACTGLVAGDKEREGDRKTPLGQFYVCYKNPESKYTLSLGLSYPNAEDAQRGLRDGLVSQEQYQAIMAAIAQHAQPPWDTPLGGEIMIHGAGSGREGTAGCVGLDDDDIRELYPILPVGTPVEIAP